MSSEELFDDDELFQLLTPTVETVVDFVQRKNYVSSIGDAVFQELPICPDDRLDKLLYYFYYSVQFVLLYTKLDGKKPVPDIFKDSNDTIREKAYFIHLDHCYKKFNELIKEITNNVYNDIFERVSAHTHNDKKHRIMEIFKYIVVYKEMHTRRIKSDPTATRTKTTETTKTRNIITDEYYDPENKDHKTWRVIILNPLPSDFDPNAKDPNEGDDGARNAIMINHLKNQGKDTVPDPFCFVVTTEFDKLLRLLHVLLHFDDYMCMYIVGCLTNEEFEHIDQLEKWKDIWNYVMSPEHAEVPIQNLSREKKKVPEFVSRIAEIRDFLKVSLQYEGKNSYGVL
jgi:hypothetical protein